jgi:hypothetical protein
VALSDNLIAYYSLDEASGNALDAHGSNDLTENSTVGIGTGKVNGARDFEQTESDYFEIADNTDLSTGDIDFTIALWFKPESTPVINGIACKGTAGGANTEWSLFSFLTSNWQFQVYQSTTAYTAINSAVAPSAGNWFFLVAWHDSAANTINLQVNNGKPASTAHSIGVNDGNESFNIGRASATYFGDGLIDEVGFWKRVLTSDERTELYNSGSGRDYAYITGGGGGAASRLTKYAQNIPYMHGNNRFIRIGR